MQFALWKFSYALHSSWDKRIAFPTPGRHVNLSGTQEGATLEPGWEVLTVRARSLHIPLWVRSCSLISVSHLRQFWMYSWLPMQCLLWNKSMDSHARAVLSQKLTLNIPGFIALKQGNGESTSTPPLIWFLLLHAIADTSTCAKALHDSG